LVEENINSLIEQKFQIFQQLVFNSLLLLLASNYFWLYRHR